MGWKWVSRLRQLFEAFNRKHDMLRLLDQCMHAEGVHIFIGEESGYAVMHECSIVTARYWAGEKALGVVGVIGPTRMAYERVIPIVDVTAKLLASALKSRS
jgi:heat-inducible transcriptional repressor